VVLTCIGAETPLITPELVRGALRSRRQRPIFAIDIGVPRNIDPAVNELDGVYLYDLDDLTGVAEANVEQRRREVERAEVIVREEQQRFEGWLTALSAVPTIRALRARAEAVRERELERGLANLELGARERDAVEALTRAIVNKILHPPISRLRAELEREEGLAHLEAARALFGLDTVEEGDGGEDPSADGEA
jgi:glutamyl-tRNA reductase